ncbi:MAG: hypothetical protein QOC73_430 [Actinomycetota bacterium]|nr:hypothetical protein [Actinomycetota bacterium]
MTQTPPSVVTPPAVADFEKFVAAAVEDILTRQPVLASSLGDHRFDDRLDDLRPAAVDEERQVLAARLAEIDGWSDISLPVPHRVDAEVLRIRLQERLLELDEQGEHHWNPLVANPGTALYLLLARDYAPLPDRLRSAAGRLAQIPEQLEAARHTLREMPKVHLETAIDQFGGTLAMLGTQLPGHLDEAPDVRSLVEPVLAAASDAVSLHIAWLREQLEHADGDPRQGPDRFGRKLSLVLDVDTSPEQVLADAQAELERVEAELTEVAASLGGAPRDVFDRLAAEAPTDDSVVSVARTAMEEATAFVRETDLITRYDDPVEVIVMPEIHRGVAIAYCDPPGPLDPPGTTTFFAISPTPQDWPAERVVSFYREYNVYALRNLVIHEAMPGHVLQLAHSRRAPTVTKARQAFWSGPFVEGWAVYAESEMIRHGFGGPQVHMQQLKMRLRTAINAVLDVRVHCDGLSRDDAMALMTGRGHQEEGEATGKWRRALLTSAQLSTYFVGVKQIDGVAGQLRAARPGWSDREVHDAMLGHGNPPPRHLPALLSIAP